jgi:murein tripeptide amidase MpaA
VFYVIPMVNIDGVVFGHYRTNLAGKDLNRKWNSTEKDFNCPEIAAIKSYLN